MFVTLFRALKSPYAEIWLPHYLRREVRRRFASEVRGTRHLIFCFVDHYEPGWHSADTPEARRRLDAWLYDYPRIADRHGDWHGRPPGHSFFYPYDMLDAAELRDLSALCAAGYGELEIHLHHRDDTSETLRAKLRDALRLWREVGALGIWPGTHRPAFGFIHGDWALDNSRHDGGRNYCGVNDEITLLAEEGCYADFTFPALDVPAQPRLTNTIYYATDDPTRPKSYDRGVPVRVGGRQEGQLMIIQGPLCLRRKGGLVPRREDGDVTGLNGASPERVDAWVRTNVHIPGRPEWTFVKVHTHGAADHCRDGLLSGGLEALFTALEKGYNDGQAWRLHYVTAREMYNIVRAAEAGRDGDPSEYRDFAIAPPGARVPSAV
jgi:hypothetical protein